MNKYKLEERIQELVTRAGVVEPVAGGQGTFASEPILVFYESNHSSLEIFDQYGHAVGNAKRIPGRYSRDGYQCRYELGDTEPRFAITDISKGRWVSIPKSFVIAAPDGSPVASAVRPTELEGDQAYDEALTEYESFVFTQHNETLAFLREMSRKERRRAGPRPEASSRIGQLWQLRDRFDGRKLFSLQDHSHREVARITYLLPATIGSKPGYVLELQAGAQERFSTIAIAACLIADNAFVHRSGGGGGA